MPPGPVLRMTRPRVTAVYDVVRARSAAGPVRRFQPTGAARLTAADDVGDETDQAGATHRGRCPTCVAAP
jgi:hypothetical protein